MAGRCSSTTETFPLFDTIWRVFRVSPLYLGTGSLRDPQQLPVHAKRCFTQPTGDLDTNQSPHIPFSILQGCEWKFVDCGKTWKNQPGADTDDIVSESADAASSDIYISIPEANPSQEAFLLNANTITFKRAIGDKKGFETWPLLLVRMTASHQRALLTYLATTFDCHIAPLNLSSQEMVAFVEHYLSNWSDLEYADEELSEIDGFNVELTFPTATKDLSSIDMKISAKDFPTFFEGNNGEGRQKFGSALERYCQKTLALDITHEAVRIASIACRAFNVGVPGRLRISSSMPQGSADLKSRRLQASLSLIVYLVILASRTSERDGSSSTDLT